MYLILIDAHSKWMEVHITSGATSAITINKMKLTFSSLGFPEILVTDNGPAFASQEFTAFTKANGERHKYHFSAISPDLERARRESCSNLQSSYEKAQTGSYGR